MTQVTFMDTQLEQSYTYVVYHFWEAPKFSLTGTVLCKGVFKVLVVMSYLLNTLPILMICFLHAAAFFF